MRLRREQSGLAHFAEPKQLKAIEDGLTLGGFGGDGLYLSYYPLLTKALAAEKTLLPPTRKLILEEGLQGSAKFIDDGLYCGYYPLAEILLAEGNTL